MSVQKKETLKSDRMSEKQNFKISSVDDEELREIFDILKKDKETCSLGDLNVALVFLEQQLNYKLEARVKHDIKDLESNVVEPELTFEQFKDLITQYDEEAVLQEIEQLSDFVKDKGDIKKNLT